jgi:hypothetical protein
MSSLKLLKYVNVSPKANKKTKNDLINSKKKIKIKNYFKKQIKKIKEKRFFLVEIKKKKLKKTNENKKKKPFFILYLFCINFYYFRLF